MFLEKLLGIYRGYCNQKDVKKCLIIFQVFLQTMFHTIILIFEVYFLVYTAGDTNPLNLTYGGYAITAYMTAIPSVFTGVIYSREFQSYLTSISRVFETFKYDKKLFNSLKKLYWLSVILILFFIVYGVLRSADGLLRILKLSELLFGSFVMVSQTLLRTTILFTYLVFFVVVIIVYLLCKCLTSLVLDVQERVGKRDISSDEKCDITREQVQGWVEMYQDLVNCCDVVMLCFGRQVLFF